MMQLKLNGKTVTIPDDRQDERLIWALHDTLKLNGTRYGCGAGWCGSCTVLVDNIAIRSCQTIVAKVVDRDLITLEGLAEGANLHPVQQAFLENPLQCCYCMTGHIMTAVAFLRQNPHPNPVEIDAAMDVNLCRCGGYNNIRKNVLRASQLMRGQS
jgi:aerobic-type carbon monoxide dehydrogenase small subunit (CoxS/CutS family)